MKWFIVSLVFSFVLIGCQDVNFERTYQVIKPNTVLSKSNRFGLTKEINDLHSGEVLEVTLNKSIKNSLVRLVADGSWENHYFESSWSDQEGDYYKLRLCIEVPFGIENASVKFYGYNLSNEKVLIDSLLIRRYTQKKDSIPNYVIVPLLYDLMQDYQLRFYRDGMKKEYLNWFNGKEVDPLFLKHSVSKDKFIEIFKNTEFDNLIAQVKEYKKNVHYSSVKYISEPFNEKVENLYSTSLYLKEGNRFSINYRNQNLTDALANVYRLRNNYTKNQIGRIRIENGKHEYESKGMTRGIYQLQTDNSSAPILVDKTKKEKVVILAPVTTWYAYNTSGGKSLYKNHFDSSDVNYISTQRELNSVYFDSTILGLDMFVLNNIYTWFDSVYGANIYPDYFLEKYPELFEDVQTIVLAQHCEYFSSKMFQMIDSLSQSRNIISLGGNQMYWKVKFHDDFKTIECRKDGDFFEGTNEIGGMWRNDLTSEARILGVAFDNRGYTSYNPYNVANESHWIFDGLNLQKGQLFGEKGIDGRGCSGDEMDKRRPESPKSTQLIAKGINPDNGGGEITIIEKDSSAVLSFGSIASGSGLGIDSTITRMLQNFMAKYH